MNKYIMQPLTEYSGEPIDLDYYYVKGYGVSGKTGLFGLSGVPKKYKTATMENLPIQNENPNVYTAIKVICQNIDEFIENGMGLFLYSIPNKNNPRGTGTGKTTTAVTILNTYIQRVLVKHVNGEEKAHDIPALFVRASKLQNLYNAQFRGTNEAQETASLKFYQEKKLMIETDLLVIDDIALRSCTEAFANELYEIIDERTSEEKAIILTSNETIETVGKILSEQIRSRIEGSCDLFGFEGVDYRKVKE